MENLKLFFVLGGLLILTLTLASVARSYQERMAEKRLRIQRLLRGVDVIENLLSRIDGCPYPKEIETLLRQDIHNRYLQVKTIDKRFQGIDSLAADAEQKLQQIQSDGVPSISDQQQLSRILGAYSETIGFFKEGWLLTPLNSEQINSVSERTATRRAEAMQTFHMQQIEKLRKEQKLHAAASHCSGIKAYLAEHGPDNKQAKIWYEEAESLRQELNELNQQADAKQ